LITHNKDRKSDTLFSQLINLKQKGSVWKHIEDLQILNIKVTNIPKEHLINVFIGNLKDKIQHEAFLWEPNSFENAFTVARKVKRKTMAIRTSTTHNYKQGSVYDPSLPQPTRLTPQQLEEKREKGLCYNCDKKYTKDHKCAKKKLFYIYCEEN